MDYIYSAFVNIVPFLVVLSLLVYVHEMGHYIVARWNGVHVEVFSIGFGPEVFGWDNKNGTRWKISLIPLGGYVRMVSEDSVAEDQATESKDPGSLFNKTPLQKIAVSIAGPAANYLFAIVVLTGLYVTSGQRVPLEQIKLLQVSEESAAGKAGIKSGDVLLKIDSVEKLSVESLQKFISENPGKDVSFQIKRGEDLLDIQVVPDKHELVSGKVVGRIGVALQPMDEKIVHGFFAAIYNSCADTIKMTTSTLQALGQMIIGERSAEGLSGPIGIASITGQIAQQGIVALIWLAAILSINLGLINLFPVPMLDGGHILFYVIEMVRGKPVNEKMQEIAYRIGFGLVMLLILFSTWNDLLRLKFIPWITGLFG